jgi:hypothetical protein
MTGFLQRISATAAAPRLHPLAASLHAPASPPLEILTETIAAQPANRQPATSAPASAPPAPLQPPQAAIAAPALAFPGQPARAPQAMAPGRVPVPQQTAPASRLTLPEIVRQLTTERIAPPPGTADPAGPPTSSATAPKTLFPPAAPGPQPLPHTAAPDPVPPPAFAQPLDRQARPQPSAASEPAPIKIHIGRVEITAVPPPQAVAAKPARKAMSLDDYLRRQGSAR